MTVLRRTLALVALVLSLTPGAYGQVADSVFTQPPDTVIQDDALPEASPDTLAPAHSPRGALWRAAVLPGWGQAYNHQYVKMPFVYAGFVGVAWLLVYNNKNYLLYRHAYQYRAWAERPKPGVPNPAERYKDEYEQVKARYGYNREIESGALRNARDGFRRNRDLSYFGIGIFYGLTILDAYVAAHLFDFDIDENLSARLGPSPAGGTLALRYSF